MQIAEDGARHVGPVVRTAIGRDVNNPKVRLAQVSRKPFA
jgi:hypothetical protein